MATIGQSHTQFPAIKIAATESKAHPSPGSGQALRGLGSSRRRPTLPSVGADLSAAIEEYAIALLATKGCLKNRLFVIDATLPVYYALCQMGIMHFITKWCMEVGEKLMVKTFEEARLLIRELQICTIFESSKSGLPSLWEYVDLPEKQPGEEGWGEKVTAVWDWKNRLPATYPDEIFYGKIKGGFAVLMTMGYLRDFHFASCHRSIAQLNPLAATIFEKIRNEPWETTELRYEVMEAYGCSKSQFDTALKNLQISLNIVRSNDPGIDRDTWLPFQEIYPDLWQLHVVED